MGILEKHRGSISYWEEKPSEEGHARNDLVVVFCCCCFVLFCFVFMFRRRVFLSAWWFPSTIFCFCDVWVCVRAGLVEFKDVKVAPHHVHRAQQLKLAVLIKERPV